MSVTLLQRLQNRTVNVDWAAQAPSTVEVDGFGRPVVASAYLPPREGELPAHLVVYAARYGGSEVGPESLIWAVSVLVHDESKKTYFGEQPYYLTSGEYDLTFAEAMALFVQRIERQG